MIAAHNLGGEREQLRRQAEDAIAENSSALFTLAQDVWVSTSDVLSCATLLTLPEIAQISAQHPKETPLQTTPPS
ncbi:hypothetical protein D3C86_2116930 [compost metagenome]